MGISKGYNYNTGRWSLDCDKCGELGASRIKCPILYCVPVQLCKECVKATSWRKKEKHAKCYAEHAENELKRVQFLAENSNKWITTSAWGSWAEWVPNGMVGVCAYVGGNAAGRQGEPTYFLVPENEYQSRGEDGFIIDENKHVRFDNDPTQLTSKNLSLT